MDQTTARQLAAQQASGFAPRKGLRFVHTKYREITPGALQDRATREQRSHSIFRVTLVKGDRIYYRAADEPGKSTHTMRLDTWRQWARPVPHEGA